MASPPQAGSSPAGASGDPSMEDILASIRRILTEDEAAPAVTPSPPPAPVAAPAPAPVAAPAPPAPPPAMVAEEDDGVLDLSAAMLVADTHEPPVESAAPPAAPEPVRDTTFNEEILEPVPPRMAAEDEQLLAPEPAAAAATSVSHLVRRLSAERGAAVYRGGPTIEDVVREEMRPLLKLWLDENLPRLVERLVRAEIERVVARGIE